ncbi:hypothetical protein [Pseudonocardia sp. ICBG1293]|uniref:hypothetical protein n=1 Tax=Pseudonocardia sp. ICBG1293 TaxID=2844382 RepID=UPI001CCE5EC8|nr:hypothetical protein [Pseudonocardia sp. ICBG1293]
MNGPAHAVVRSRGPASRGGIGTARALADPRTELSSASLRRRLPRPGPGRDDADHARLLTVLLRSVREPAAAA